MKMWRGFTAILAILLSFSILMTNLLISWSGQVNIFLNVSAPTIEADENSIVYDSAYGLSDEGLVKMLEASDAHDTQTMIEGAVLLKNENAALPLADTEKRVTLFGRASADPVYRGNSGGPSMDEDRQVSLYDALTAEGFAINDTLFNAYAQSDVKRVKGDPDWFIGEVDSSFYTEELKASFAEDYQDAAIVVFSRDGGEGKDLAMSDRDGISYLALHDTEKDLLRMIQESGKFEKTIVLINSAYPMELGWLDEEEYGVDAALWMGTPGLKGFTGVAQILSGAAEPSGRLIDTYAANSLSAPAVRNAGDFTFSNTGEHYVVEAEGIYVGYKYYETRYQDQVLGINNANSEAGIYAGEQEGWDYAAEMVYSFGYGLSYADFSQELLSMDWNRDEHTLTAVVKVTNQGYPENSSYKGTAKSVVELYASLPYETGQAEKSAIQLIGFGKTDQLAVGESEEVTIVVDDYLFATYDSNAVNGADTSKMGCYVFDAGDYYFAIGSDCHDALNNVIAAKTEEDTNVQLFDAAGNLVTGDTAKTVCVTLSETDNTTYAVSVETGEVVSNQFETADLNYFKPDEVTYLTRDDWNTYPVSYTDLSATDEMIALFSDDTYDVPDDAPSYDSFAQETDHDLMLADMKDVAFDDDETWDLFLDQLSLQELSSVIGDNFGQEAVETVGKPVNTNNDGPAGTQGTYQYGNHGAATVHVGEAVAAATWNQTLLEERGSFIAEDCLFVGTQQLWSPGANIHRTPFSGRNFEYYSEDSIMSYLMGAAQTAGMQEKGLNAAIKHFCANDQETNRSGLCVFMSEQGYRQGPLKGFEGAFTKGGALGTMMSFSRIGCVRMYQDAATLTQVLRNEWGFEGVTITDSVKGETGVSTVASLASGTDTFNADPGRSSEVLKYLVANKDGYILQCLRQANKRFYYAMANSNLMNGLTRDMVISDFVPWWHKALYALDIVIGVLTVACAGLFIYHAFGKRRKEKD
jgi:beta-glucosidase